MMRRRAGAILVAAMLVRSACLAATEIPLGSLDLGHATCGWGKPMANRSSDGKPMTIAGRKFSAGVGVHADSRICLRLDGKASGFSSFVGVDDEVTPKLGTVRFHVLADGKEVWDSGIMKTGDAAREVKLPLAGVNQLMLVVDDGDDDINNDHADWADARVTGDPSAVAIIPLPTGKRFPHPERIRYDGQCMTIEGKDTFIYAATFHYFRTPRELWRDRFQKIKDAGFNTIETYVPWNWHEREMPAGPDDFSKVDLTDIKEWLRMAHDDFGLYTIVRPGPFICAEWAGGGYPRWLAKFAPGTGGLWLRGADDAHIAWGVHWYDAVCKLFAREQLVAKPKGAKGIIMVQLENEYNHHSCGGKSNVLKALYNAAVRAGIEVPLFTCATNETRGSKDPTLSQVFDCDNYYIGLTDAPGCAHRMAGLRRQQPDAPGFVTELQGGWFSLIGGGLSDENYSDYRHFNAIHWMSLLGGATGLDPYVFVGGTHFDGWGARGQTTSYDYNAGIRESGARGPKYFVAMGVAGFIRENEASLLRSQGGPCELRNAPENLFGGVRVAPDGTRFVFLHNTDPVKPAAGTLTVVAGADTFPKEPMYNINQYGEKVLIKPIAGTRPGAVLPPFDVTYDLADLGAMVLVIPPGKSPDQGMWYPRPLTLPRHPADPPPVRIATARRKNDPLTGAWHALPDGKSLPELGISDHRYVLYRASVDLTALDAARWSHLLVNAFSRDIVGAQVNGVLAKRLAPGDNQAAGIWRDSGKSHSRIGADEFDNIFATGGLLKAGRNDLVLVYENIGHEHGYVPMEELGGIRRAGFGADDKTIAAPLAWELADNLGGISSGWTKDGFAATGWDTVVLDTSMTVPRMGNKIQPKASPDGLLTWYQLEFELPAMDPAIWTPWLLRINASGNGYMWLNGHNIGRHHEHGPQREFYLPECWLRFGKGHINTIMLGLRQTCNGATIRAAEVAPYPGASEILE